MDAVEEMMKAINRLDAGLKALVRAQSEDDLWTPTMYIDARSFLRQLDEAVRALELPGAGKYLGGNYAPRGQTVGELVEYMKANGLQFAPANAGSESAYLALYRAFRNYDAQYGTPVRARR